MQTPSVGVVRPVESVISIPESRPAQYTDSGETSGAIRSPSSLLSVALSHPFTTRTHAHLSLAPHIAKVLLNLLRHSAATRVQAPSWSVSVFGEASFVKSDHLSTTSAYIQHGRCIFLSAPRGILCSVCCSGCRGFQFRSVPCGRRVWSNLSLDPLWPELAPRTTVLSA